MGERPLLVFCERTDAARDQCQMPGTVAAVRVHAETYPQSLIMPQQLALVTDALKHAMDRVFTSLWVPVNKLDGLVQCVVGDADAMKP